MTNGNNNDLRVWVDLGVDLSPMRAGFAQARQLALKEATALEREVKRINARTAQAVAAGSQSATASVQRKTAADRQADQAAKAKLRTDQQIAAITLKNSLATADHANRIRILTAEQRKHTQGSLEYLRIQGQLIKSEQSYTREMQRSFDQRRKAQTAGAGAGAALPRTFAGFTGGGALQAAGALGLATSAAEVISQVNQLATQGARINVILDGNRRALGALLGDVDKGDDIWQRGIAQAREWGYTQQEAGEAIRSASFLIQNSTAPIEKILEVQARLAAISPEQGLAGAAFAARELASGDTVSLVERFEIPREAANRWRDEIRAGADAVEVLDRGLAEMGATNAIIAAGMEGLAGQQKDYNQAIEDLQMVLGKLIQSTGWLEFKTFLARGATGVLGVLSGDVGFGDLQKAFENLARTGKLDLTSPLGILTTVMTGLTDASAGAREETEKLTQTQQIGTGITGRYSAAMSATANEKTLLENATTRLEKAISTEELAIKRAEAALRPYKDAVEDAQSAVDGLSSELADEQANFDRYANALLPEEAALIKERQQLAIEAARAQKALFDFTAPGAGLDSALGPIRDDIEEATSALDGFEQAVDAQESAVAAAEDAYEDAADAVGLYDQAVAAAERGVESTNDVLDEQKERLDTLNDAYQAQIDMIDEWQGRALVGDAANRERLQSYDDEINALEQQITRRELAGADKDDEQLKQLEERVKRVRQERRLAQLEIEAGNERARREAEDLANSRTPEYTEGQMREGITSALNESERLAGMRPGIEADLANAQAAHDAAKVSLEQATEAQRLANVRAEEAKIALDNQKASLDLANEALKAQKDRVSELEQQLKTTTEQSLAPFQAAIDEVARRSEAADLREKLEIIPLRDEINSLKQPIETIPYGVLIEGMRTSGERVADLRDRLNEANTNLATAKERLEEQEKPINDQKTRVGELNLLLDTMKADLEGINTAQGTYTKNSDTYVGKVNADATAHGTAATNVDAHAAAQERLNRAQSGAPIGPPIPTGAGSAQAVDDILKGTGLEGQGAAIASFASRYNVPIPLALSMLRKEASFNAPGSLSNRNNNPGNLRDPGGYYGGSGMNGGFRVYDTLEEGLEAYFKLLDREYRAYIDTANWGSLVGKYAPSSDGNNVAQYVSQITEWMAQYARALLESATAAVPARGSGTPLEQLMALMGQSNGRMTQGYHTGPGWGGVDLSADMGDSVKSVQAGTVVSSGFNSTGGWSVMVEDPKTGLRTYYGHLQAKGLEVGTPVNPGDEIGKAGMTGQATGPHVHFQTWLNNALQDPLKILSQILDLVYGTGSGPENVIVKALAAAIQNDAASTAPEFSTDPLNPTRMQPGMPPYAAIWDQYLDSTTGGYSKGGDAVYGITDPIVDELEQTGDKIVDAITGGKGGVPPDELIPTGIRLGSGDSMGDTDATHLGNRKGGDYGYSDPIKNIIPGDPSMWPVFGYTDPLEDSLRTMDKQTGAMKDLWAEPAWLPVVDDQEAVWTAIQLAQHESMAFMLEDSRSIISLIDAALKSLSNRVDSTQDKINGLTPPGDGGGGGGGGGDRPPINIYTQDPNKFAKAAKAAGL